MINPSPVVYINLGISKLRIRGGNSNCCVADESWWCFLMMTFSESFTSLTCMYIVNKIQCFIIKKFAVTKVCRSYRYKPQTGRHAIPLDHWPGRTYSVLWVPGTKIKSKIHFKNAIKTDSKFHVKEKLRRSLSKPSVLCRHGNGGYKGPQNPGIWPAKMA